MPRSAAGAGRFRASYWPKPCVQRSAERKSEHPRSGSSRCRRGPPSRRVRGSMVGNVIQLNQPPFWVACFVGIAVTALFGGATQRKWCLALLNLAFVGAILGAGSLGVFGG